MTRVSDKCDQRAGREELTDREGGREISYCAARGADGYTDTCTVNVITA